MSAAAAGRPDEPARWDFAIVGSGFGGSVGALRLVEKGDRVVMRSASGACSR